MLLAIGRKEPDAALQDELLSIPGLYPDDLAYLQQLADLRQKAIASPPVVTTNPLKQAEEAGQRFNWDQVLNLAPQAPPSLQKARLLFEAFYELQTLDSQREALAAFQELTSSEQETLSQTRRGRDCLEQLQGAESPAKEIPNNWVEWLQQLIMVKPSLFMNGLKTHAITMQLQSITFHC
jgi:hypothetical protein